MLALRAPLVPDWLEREIVLEMPPLQGSDPMTPKRQGPEEFADEGPLFQGIPLKYEQDLEAGIRSPKYYFLRDPSTWTEDEKRLVAGLMGESERLTGVRPTLTEFLPGQDEEC